jgi:diguanylate cyclase (GGDEF)-like protein
MNANQQDGKVWMKKIQNCLSQLSQRSIAVLSLFLILLVGGIDYVTGPEIAVSILYLLPIYLVTWRIGKKFGVLASFVSAVTWFLSDFLTKEIYLHPVVPYWNAIVMFGIFIVLTRVTAAVKTALDEHELIAQTDSLTGAANRRHFLKLAEVEINRASRYRHPFTVAYIDLDNFKTVNDRFGHNEGDDVLRVVSCTISRYLRKTDVFARLGGDEFAILLPETGNSESLHNMLENLNKTLLSAMEEKRLPVTFSIGVVIFLQPPESVDRMIELPDNLMYAAKTSGKNTIRFDEYGKRGEGGLAPPNCGKAIYIK